MQFKVDSYSDVYKTPCTIANAWKRKYARMVHSYTAEEKKFLEMFGVVFDLYLSSNYIGPWIPQAYSTYESEKEED